MQKAFKYLDKKKIKYNFHDYKQKGINKATILNWLIHFPTDQIINTKSLTFKSLSQEDKASINNKAKAIRLMVQNTSMIKRPLVDLENGKYLLGFNEEDWTAAI